MASGSRRKRGNDEYIFVDGRVMRQDEALRIDLGDATVPGQAEAASVPGAAEAMAATHGSPVRSSGKVEGHGLPSDQIAAAQATKRTRGRGKKARGNDATGQDAPARKTMGEAFREMEESDAFELTEEAAAGNITLNRTKYLMAEDKRIMRTKYLIFGIACVVIALFALCINPTQPGQFNSPVDVIRSIGAWFTLVPSMLFDSASYGQAFAAVKADIPSYANCMLQTWNVAKFAISGMLLALAGMLYQNTFRNPIAAPSMLGVSNGMNVALLVLVLQFGTYATGYVDLYYIYSIIGGVLVLVLVLAGGKWISGKGRFNVVNMILMGTVISQLLGVIMTYANAYLLDDATLITYSELQSATNLTSGLSFAVLIIGAIISIAPVFMFRFRLNLISFSDEETRLLGADPTKLRIVSLACGSIMILVAQLTCGQVAMASLMIPFLVRSVFGSEFRKQLGGNILAGMLVLLVCGVLGQLIAIDGVAVGMGPIVSIIAIPLLVWMLAIRQRSWD